MIKQDPSTHFFVLPKDEEFIIRKRMAFHMETTPRVTQFFLQRDVANYTIDANRSMDKVYEDFKHIIFKCISSS